MITLTLPRRLRGAGPSLSPREREEAAQPPKREGDEEGR